MQGLVDLFISVFLTFLTLREQNSIFENICHAVAFSRCLTVFLADALGGGGSCRGAAHKLSDC